MRRLLPFRLALVVLACATGASAQGQSVGVRDQARMFSAEAVQKATTALQELERDRHLRVLVETVESLGGQSAKEKAAAKVRTIQGPALYVLISKNEHKVEIEPTQAAATVFSSDENKALVKLIVDAFKAREFDRGLAAAVSEIQKRATPVTGIRDRAGMFSTAAIQQAEKTLKEIQRDSKWQVVIETVNSLNGRTAKEVAIANASALKLHGVYILIAKADHKDYIEPSRSAQAVFTPAKVTELVGVLERAFKASQFDRGLLDTVGQIQKDVQPVASPTTPRPAPTVAVRTPVPKDVARPTESATHQPVTAPKATTPIPPSPVANTQPINLPPAPVAPAKSGFSFLPILIIGGLGFLALLWLLSRALRGGQQADGPQGGWQNPQSDPRAHPVPPQGFGPQPGYGAPPPGYGPAGYGPPPRQGGGFMSGLLGGAAGAVVGNIVYDQFGRPHTPQGQPLHEHGGRYADDHQPAISPDAGAGGDWGTGGSQGGSTAEDWSGSAGASGDWGSNEPAADEGAGGDWGSDPTPDYGGDADSGGDGGAGGDWGGDAPDTDQSQEGGW